MPPTATATDANSRTTIETNRLATHGLYAASAAIAANGAILAVALHVLDVPGGFPLSWGPVLASSAIPAIVATVVYGVIARVSGRPNRTFAAVAAVVLTLSFVPFVSPPPELSGASLSVFVTLAAMHVAAAVAIVGLLTRVPHPADSAGNPP